MKRSNNDGSKSQRKNKKRNKNGMNHQRRTNGENQQNNGNKKNNSNDNNNNRTHQRNQKRKQNKEKKDFIQTGNFGSFLEGKEWPDELLLGQMPASNDPRVSDLECIAQFLADYRAMSTLHLHARQSNNNSPTNGNSSKNNTNENHSPCHSHSSTAYYIPVVQDFALTQKDRQSAGLRTNTSRETSEGMTQVVESHVKALETAMEHVDPFQSTLFSQPEESSNESQDHLVPTKQTLCQWHSLLVANTAASPGSNNTNNTAAAAASTFTTIRQSTFRKSRAKAGKTVFCPPNNIPNEFHLFRKSMIRYCQKWESKILLLQEQRKRSGSITSAMAVDSAAATELAQQMTQQKHASIYHALGVAAMYLFGIVDIHMYSDGNGRMSRIGANWMLKRMLGWPFTVTLVANQQQRREYISALQHAVTCIQRQRQRQQAPTSAQEHSIFRPLIMLLLDRMANAARECQRKLTEKSQLTREAEEARIARKVREATASGRCVICLDDNPNIATLCCGQGVHLNCIAEWLANNSNCVYCRGPLPQLKIQRAPPPEEEEEPETVGGVIVSEIQNVLAMPDANMAAATAAAVSRLTSNPAVLNLIRQSLQDQAMQNAEDSISMHSTTTTTFSSDEEEEEEDADDEDGNASNSSTTMICTRDTCTRQTMTWCPNGMCSQCCANSGVHCWFHNGTVDSPDEEEDTTSLLDDEEDEDEEDTTTYYGEEDDNQEQSGSSGSGGDTTTFYGDDDDEEDEEDTTTDAPARQNNQRAVCCSTGDCNNRPAADCQNHMCGRCCVLFGRYNCQRHNTGSFAN